MSPVVRFSTPLVNSYPAPPSAPKCTAKPARPVGSRELVDPVLQEFPSTNSPLYNIGLQRIRKTLGNDAFIVMHELSDHSPQFQLTPAKVAELVGMSRTACNAAIQQLILAGFAERVECRKGGRRHGHVLHSRLEGNIQKLTGFVTHYSVEANTKEAATRHGYQKGGCVAPNPNNLDRPKTGNNHESQS